MWMDQDRHWLNICGSAFSKAPTVATYICEVTSFGSQWPISGALYRLPLRTLLYRDCSEADRTSYTAVLAEQRSAVCHII